MIGISRLYCGTIGPSEALRYGANDGAGVEIKKPVVVWNCTRRCNLDCAHCYLKSSDRAFPGEMATDKAMAMLDDLAAFGVPVLLLSGGEPLMRADLLGLAAHAVKLGLRTAVSTNGTLVSPEMASRLGEAGVSYVGVSLDGLEATHDAFRGRRGAFAEAIAAIRNCRSANIKVGLRFTITRRNARDIPGIFHLLAEEGIDRACFYHLVGVGRGEGLGREDLDHHARRRAVDLIIDKTAELHGKGVPAEVLTVDNHADGPYLYMRMVREGSPRAAEVLRLLRINGGSSSGCGIGCVSWDGQVHPDQFWRSVSLGNVLRRRFSEIWTDGSNPLLARLRDKRRYVKGRCASCRFLDICGGNMRVRAETATGDAWAPDPACYLSDEEIASKSPCEDD